MRSASQIWIVRFGGTLTSTSFIARMLSFLRKTIFSSARRYSNGNRNRQLKLPSPVNDLSPSYHIIINHSTSVPRKALSTMATTVAEFGDSHRFRWLLPNSATKTATIVAKIGDYSRQCGQGLTCGACSPRRKKCIPRYLGDLIEMISRVSSRTKTV